MIKNTIKISVNLTAFSRRKALMWIDGSNDTSLDTAPNGMCIDAALEN